MAAKPLVTAAIRNDTEIADPVILPAVDAARVKIPTPITTETPKTVRSQDVRSLRNRQFGSSVSAIDCSTALIRHSMAESF